MSTISNCEVKSKPKLSLLAQFDDMCRTSDQLLASSAQEHSIIGELITNLEENRNQWHSDRNRLEMLSIENRNLKLKIKQMDNFVKSVLKKKNNLRQQTIDLKKRLKTIQELVDKNYETDSNRFRFDFELDLEDITEESDRDHSDNRSLD